MQLLFAMFFLVAATGGAAARESAPGENVSVAAAANFVYALEALNAAFAARAPDVKVTVATGASGNLVAQIEQGAPYDIFLSADRQYPQALVTEGHADARSLTIFAVGRLVLWTTNPAVELRSIPETVRSGAVRKLALANINSAPYGRAAKQALEKLGEWAGAQSKLVVGENISQTAQFVATGNADAGFVALSLVLSPKLQDKGRWMEVAGNLYSPLEHAAVLTMRGATNPAAKRYLEFLRSDVARKIFERFGYAVPAR
jgi:molybdate transport system substrate-binding protein